MKRTMQRTATLVLFSVLLAAACKQPEIDLPPSISFGSGYSEGEYVSGIILLEGSARDDVGISIVELSFDNGVSYQAASGTGSWSYYIDTTALPDTVLPIRARVRDTSGYYNYAFMNLIVDNEGPIVRIINPSDERPVNGFVPIIGTGNRVSSVKIKVDRLSDSSPVTAGWVDAEGTVVWSKVIDVTDLEETEYKVSVQGFRASPYKEGAVVEATFRVDKTVPALAFTDPSSSSNVITYLKDTVLFAGTAADANGIALVEISFNGGTSWENASGTSSWSLYKDTNTLGDGIRTVVARAKDTTGLFSTVNIPVNIDNKPPVVEITQPLENGLVAGVFTVRGTSFDAGGIQEVSLKLNASPQIVSGTTNWNADVDVSALPNGPHSLTAVAKDMGNTEGTPYTIAIIVDNNLPDFGPFTGIADNGYYKGSLSMSGTVSDADAGDMISSVQVKIGSGAFSSVGSFDGSAWSTTLDTAGYSDGAKTVTFRVTDEWGGYRERSFSVVFDNTQPSLAMTQPLADAEVSGRVTITGSASDAYTVDYLRLRIKTDGAGSWDIVDADIKASLAAGLWSYQWDSTLLPEGLYQIQAEARDKAGNARIIDRMVEKTDNVPSISVDLPLNGAYVGGTISVSGQAAAPVGIIDGVKVRFNAGTEYDATPAGPGDWSTWTIGSMDTVALSDGLNTVTARVSADGGTYTNSASVSIHVDNTPPSISITAPTSAAVGAQALYGPQTITGTASDANLTDVILVIDGGAPVSLGALTSYSHAWNTAIVTGVAGTNKLIQAKAVDRAGNETTTSVTVDVRPHITALSKVTAIRGDTITITGFNFAAGSRVNFPNAASTVPTSVSGSTSMNVVIPGTATSGQVTVTTNGVDSNGVNLDLWQVDQIESDGTFPALTRDPSGNLYAAYQMAQYKTNPGNQNTRAIGFHVKPAAGAWGAQIKVDVTLANGIEMTYLSMAADATYVYIAYQFKGTPTGLKLARYAISGGTWTITPVSTGTYAFTSLGLHGSDLYLSAYDVTLKKLVAFKLTNNGTTVSNSWDVDSSSADVGRFTALGVTPAGNPVIAYRDALNKTLKLAYYTGVEWAVPRTIDTGNVGEYASLKIHTDGTVHIAYFDSVRGDLNYAKASSPSAAFTIEPVAAEGIGGLFSSVTLDGSGKPHVAYYDFSSNSIVYARKTGASWEVFPIPPRTATEVLIYPNTFTGIVLDGSKPYIVYPANEGTLGASFIP